MYTHTHTHIQLNKKETKSSAEKNNPSEKHAMEPLSNKRLLFKNYKKTIQLSSKRHLILKIFKWLEYIILQRKQTSGTQVYKKYALHH